MLNRKNVLSEFPQAMSGTINVSSRGASKQNRNYMEWLIEQGVKYFSFASADTMSTSEANKFQRILELAENNKDLSLLFDEIDNIIFEQRVCVNSIEIERYENEKARIEEFFISDKN